MRLGIGLDLTNLAALGGGGGGTVTGPFFLDLPGGFGAGDYGYALAVNPGNTQIGGVVALGGGVANHVVIWDRATGAIVRDVEFSDPSFNPAAWSNDLTTVWGTTGGGAGWADTTTGVVTTVSDIPTGTSRIFACSADGQYAYGQSTVPSANRATWWDKATGTPTILSDTFNFRVSGGSRDGTLVFGFPDSNIPGEGLVRGQPVVWNRATGVRTDLTKNIGVTDELIFLLASNSDNSIVAAFIDGTPQRAAFWSLPAGIGTSVNGNSQSLGMAQTVNRMVGLDTDTGGALFWNLPNPAVILLPNDGLVAVDGYTSEADGASNDGHVIVGDGMRVSDQLDVPIYWLVGP